MTDDLDISRAAKVMIDRHGERADLRANRRSKELLLRGYLEASELWRQIVAAIRDLRGTEPIQRP